MEVGTGFDVDLDTPFEPLRGWVATWAPDGSRLIAFWDSTEDGISVDAQTGEYVPLDWPLTVTDRPSWQRLAPGGG